MLDARNSAYVFVKSSDIVLFGPDSMMTALMFN